MYGTLHISDTVASSQQTVAQFGEDNLYTEISRGFAIHNNWVNEMVDALCERTTDRLRLYGGLDDVQNEQMGEESRPDASKITAGVNIGFPLYRFGSSMQWTRDYFRTATVSEIVAQANAHANKDRLQIVRQIKLALMTPTNNLAYKDRLANRQAANVTLPIRALLNADSTVVPQGPNGETFDASTHTHYAGYASGAVAAADVTLAVNTVLEHGVPTNLVMWIPIGLEATIRGYTGAGQFQPYTDARIRQPLDATYAIGRNLDVNNTGDRAIGIYGAAEVWVKPWMPSNYIIVVDTGGSMKPLAYRTHENDATLAEFSIRAEDESYPLRAKTMARDYGIAVGQRHMASVLYTGGSSYVAPTL